MLDEIQAEINSMRVLENTKTKFPKKEAREKLEQNSKKNERKGRNEEKRKLLLFFQLEFSLFLWLHYRCLGGFVSDCYLCIISFI